MTVKELIEALSAYDGDTVVTVDCESSSTAVHLLDGFMSVKTAREDKGESFKVINLSASYDYLSVKYDESEPWYDEIEDED